MELVIDNKDLDKLYDYFGVDKRVFEKEYYIVLCKNFEYYAKTVHLIGCTGNAVDEEICYYLDVEDEYGNNLEKYMDELEAFDSLEDAGLYADYLNNKEENKMRRKIYEKRALHDTQRVNGRSVKTKT